MVIISQEYFKKISEKIKFHFPEKVNDKTFKTIIHPTAKIHHSAQISPLRVKIGRNAAIDEYAIIESGTEIGNSVRINAHARIGIPEFLDDNLPSSLRGEGYGKVIINDGVFIHAHCTIEKPFFSDITTIGIKCHIDSLSSISAGATLGSLTLIAGLVTIGKYSSIGSRTWVGPGCLIKPGITIGNSCYVTLGSKVSKSIGPNKIVKDNWAVDRTKFKGIIP